MPSEGFLGRAQGLANEFFNAKKLFRSMQHGAT